MLKQFITLIDCPELIRRQSKDRVSYLEKKDIVNFRAKNDSMLKRENKKVITKRYRKIYRSNREE